VKIKEGEEEINKTGPAKPKGGKKKILDTSSQKEGKQYHG